MPIRPYVHDDFGTLSGFVIDDHTHEHRPLPRAKSPEQTGQDYLHYLLEQIDSHDGIILVMEKGGVAAGMICGWLDRDFDILVYEEARDHAWVSDIYVESTMRRSGIARELMEAFGEAMKLKGATRLRISARADNVHGQSFYEAAGFVPYSVTFERPL